MGKFIQIMIADEDCVFTQLVSTALCADSNVSVLPAWQTGIGLMEAIRQEKPDILLLDLMLPGVSGFSILYEVAALPADRRPSVFVVSPFASAETSAECERLGVSFFLRKPVDAASLASLMLRCCTPHTHTADNVPAAKPNLSLHITRTLNTLSIPAHVMGYRYVRDGILMTLEDPASADSVTKLLYPAIAKKYRVTWTSVERDIRNAVTLAWNRSGGHFPGFSAARRPTNREFILTIADHIRFELHPQADCDGTALFDRFLG